MNPLEIRDIVVHITSFNNDYANICLFLTCNQLYQWSRCLVIKTMVRLLKSVSLPWSFKSLNVTLWEPLLHLSPPPKKLRISIPTRDGDTIVTSLVKSVVLDITYMTRQTVLTLPETVKSLEVMSKNTKEALVVFNDDKKTSDLKLIINNRSIKKIVVSNSNTIKICLPEVKEYKNLNGGAISIDINSRVLCKRLTLLNERGFFMRAFDFRNTKMLAVTGLEFLMRSNYEKLEVLVLIPHVHYSHCHFIEPLSKDSISIPNLKVIYHCDGKMDYITKYSTNTIKCIRYNPSKNSFVKFGKVPIFEPALVL